MKSPLYLIPAFLLLVGCTAKQDINSANPTYSTAIESRIQRIVNNLQAETAIEGVYERKTLAEQLKNYHTPGLSIAVINDGKIEWARGFGIGNEATNDSVTINTLFEAGSVSKPIFALAVMRLKEKGVIDLDKDVNDYLKSWKVPANNDWQPKLSLRQLLSHTAGLTVHGFPGYLKTEAIPTLPQILNGQPPANTPAVKVNMLPGTAFRYSGGGITVAQLTIMDILGKPFPEIMSQELFKPLKLKYSTYHQPIPDSLDQITSSAFPTKGQAIKGRFHVYPEMAAAGLWSNPTELATILLEVQRSLKGQSAVFKKETIEEMLTPQKVATHIGIGFFLESKGDSARFGHGGWDEGFVTEAKAYKKVGKGAIIMVNSNEGYALLDELMKAIAIEYQWADFLPIPKKELSTTTDDLKKYAGNYTDADKNSFKIEASKNSLYLVCQNQPPIKISKAKEGTFYNPLFNFSITLEKNELKFMQQGAIKIFKKK